MKKLAFALSTLITLSILVFAPLSFSQANNTSDNQTCTSTDSDTTNGDGHTNGG